MEQDVQAGPCVAWALGIYDADLVAAANAVMDKMAEGEVQTYSIDGLV